MLWITTNIEKKKNSRYLHSGMIKVLNKFTEVRHIIEGLESERICLETVTKNTDVENEENGLVKIFKLLKML